MKLEYSARVVNRASWVSVSRTVIADWSIAHPQTPVLVASSLSSSAGVSTTIGSNSALPSSFRLAICRSECDRSRTVEWPSLS